MGGTGDVFDSIFVKELQANKLNVTQIDDLNTASIEITATIQLADSKNILVGTGTGTKLATATGQKLGFWGVTPVAQQVVATDANIATLITALTNMGLIKNS